MDEMLRIWLKPRRPLCSETPEHPAIVPGLLSPQKLCSSFWARTPLSQQVEGCPLFPPSSPLDAQGLHLRGAMMAWPPCHAAFPCLEGSTPVTAKLQTSSFQHHVASGMDYTPQVCQVLSKYWLWKIVKKEQVPVFPVWTRVISQYKFQIKMPPFLGAYIMISWFLVLNQYAGRNSRQDCILAASRHINVIQSCSLVGNKYKKVPEISEQLGFGCVERICHKCSWGKSRGRCHEFHLRTIIESGGHVCCQQQ